MAIFFRKTIKLGPINITLSKNGIGLSIGKGGVRVGANTNGRKTMSASIPGTGVTVRKSFKSTCETIAYMKEPDYITEDAAKVIYQNISTRLQTKLDLEDIVEVIETEFEFLQQCHIASTPDSIVVISIDLPAKLDEAAMEYYIINRCAQKHIYLSFEELEEILAAEMIYLEQQGLLEDEAPDPYLN